MTKVKRNKTKNNEAPPASKKKLTFKQKDFCVLYATRTEFFGNGLQAYAEAYNIKLINKKNIDKAKANAFNLLTNHYICEEIAGHLDTVGFNDVNVQKQHLFLINQFTDYKTKGKMIDSYYKIMGKLSGDLPPGLQVIIQVDGQELADSKARTAKRKAAPRKITLKKPRKIKIK